MHFPAILSNYNGMTAYICRRFIPTTAFPVVNSSHTSRTIVTAITPTRKQQFAYAINFNLTKSLSVMQHLVFLDADRVITSCDYLHGCQIRQRSKVARTIRFWIKYPKLWNRLKVLFKNVDVCWIFVCFITQH